MSESEPMMMIVGGESRKRGRPRLADPQERVSTRIPAGAYDQLVKAANRREQSVSSLVRSILLAQSFLGKRTSR